MPIYKIALDIRTALDIENEHGLHGKCIEASDSIVSRLKDIGIEAVAVEGWCIYDDEYYGSDRPYDEHTWVEAQVDGKTLFIDVTLDQFQAGMDDPIPAICIGEVPDFLVLREPKHLSSYLAP